MVKTKELIEKIQGIDFLSSYKVEQNPYIKVKLQALHHLQNGKAISFVSEVVLYDEKTIKSWLYNFVLYDYEGLLIKEGRGRKPRLPKENEEEFIDKLQEMEDERNGGRITAYDIQSLLFEQFDCNYSISGVYSLLDRLNIVWISGRSKHPNSKEEAIEEFKKNFPEELTNIMMESDTDKIEVWWQDECRVGQQGSLSRTWASKGTRPRVVRQKQFMSTYIFGAVCPERDVGCALILPQANAGMMQMHIDQISEHVQEGHIALVLMDRAGWHTTETLNIPENIKFLPLPPYSPELNPMEQVWKKLKEIKLSNISFETYDDILSACCEAWNCFADHEGNIQDLCSRNWAKF